MKDINIANFDEHLEFNYTMKSFMGDTLVLSLLFKNPLSYHSRVDTKDLIQVTLLKPNIFIVDMEESFKYVIGNLELQSVIP